MDAFGQPRPWAQGLDDAYAYCERIARGRLAAHPLVSQLLPAALRRHVEAVYAFLRVADDFADEPEFEGRRREALAYWEELLLRAFHGEADHPVFVALRATIDVCQLSFNPLQELLSGFAMDLAVDRYATFGDLERYCRLTAQPIGRLALQILGLSDPGLSRFSDPICTGFQLAHLCRGVAAAAGAGRIYLPQEDLVHFGVSEESILARRFTPAFGRLMEFQVLRARTFFARGRPLADLVGARHRDPLALAFRAFETIVADIQATGYDVLG